MLEWIRESNLIEGIDDPREDFRSGKAWDWFWKQKMNFNTIRAVHGKITKHQLDPDDSGRWRQCSVSVGLRICPDWELIPTLMHHWIAMHSLANTETSIITAHIEFEKIHPFIDGNGRTGRMIMNWQRGKAGLPALCIKASEREEYYKWFK